MESSYELTQAPISKSLLWKNEKKKKTYDESFFHKVWGRESFRFFLEIPEVCMFELSHATLVIRPFLRFSSHTYRGEQVIQWLYKLVKCYDFLFSTCLSFPLDAPTRPPLSLALHSGACLSAFLRVQAMRRIARARTLNHESLLRGIPSAVVGLKNPLYGLERHEESLPLLRPLAISPLIRFIPPPLALDRAHQPQLIRPPPRVSTSRVSL